MTINVSSQIFVSHGKIMLLNKGSFHVTFLVVNSTFYYSIVPKVAIFTIAFDVHLYYFGNIPTHNKQNYAFILWKSYSFSLAHIFKPTDEQDRAIGYNMRCFVTIE
jgi:hypothetical protein